MMNFTLMTLVILKTFLRIFCLYSYRFEAIIILFLLCHLNLMFLFLDFKVSKMVWNTVKDFLNHDSLHANANHVEQQKAGSQNCRGKPLPSIRMTRKEINFLCHDASHDLDQHYNYNQNNLEEYIRVHLLCENRFDYVDWVIA